MRLQAAISGVPFTPPSMAGKNVNDLFEYDAALKASYEEYCTAVSVHGSLEDQVLAHMRLYYGWLKVRFDADPRQIYADIDALEEDSKKELAKIQSLHSKMSNDSGPAPRIGAWQRWRDMTGDATMHVVLLRFSRPAKVGGTRLAPTFLR
ncbi:hypothetical protein [Pandoraea sp. NPDC090278]|uniref:hypothetical protein n=1 Tax=Pandoraea sp. NPDC090278 TaxID=3364391 RepID=UPI00383B8AA8